MSISRVKAVSLSTRLLRSKYWVATRPSTKSRLSWLRDSS